MRPQRPVAVACLYAAAAGGARGQSTASVYLPEYGESDWAALRGSILSSNKSVTAYTIFCAEQAPSCQIAADLPFVFTEGAHTLVYTGSVPETLTADLECDLDGKTAATCTGSSSYGSGYQQGAITGPTETVWTKTFNASHVTWGVLTLTTPGPLAGTTDIDGTVVVTATTTPAPASGAGRASGRMWVMVAALGAAVLGTFGA
ncbi:hypothetical protein MMYC01_201529 [Madurella mycetomatis]|uniref:Uncharacterized protein n=1 Tax=Madurella mycetomatis TaxID=100816 RepID=A0A175WF50_9PEZI|nr:hypothetical protein MMYC01_201529 [Madurella mycetomatis]